MSGSHLLGEGLTEQWRCRPHPGPLAGLCCLRCPETAAGRHPAPEKAPMICSSSVSGIMENRDTRLAPGFPLTPLFQHQRMWLFSGLLAPLPVWGPHSLYRLSSQQGNRLSPCGPKPPRTPLCSWGLALPTRAPPGMELESFRLRSPFVDS